MLPDLARRFAQLEERKSVILSRVEAMTDAERAAPLGPGEWSPVQLVHHLVLAEEQGDREIAAATAGDLRRRGRPSPFLLIGQVVMRLGIRVPVPETMVPQGDVPLDALKERWESSRRTLKERLEAIDPERDALSLHPIAGPLDAAEYLRFHDVHLLYHQRQFARMLGAAQQRAVS